MKKSILLFALATICTALFFTSCEKDEGAIPNISFKTGGNYVSANDTVNVGDTILVGINASKAEKKDPLKSFDVTRSYDGGAGTSIMSQELSGGDGDNFSKDVTLIMRNTAGTEKYTFTVINKDGLKNSVTLTMVVVP